MRSRIQVVLRLIAVVALGGCGQGISPPKTALVSGSVTLNGKPVPGVVVKFHPQFDIGRIKYIPLGETGRDGKFTLSTGAQGNGAPTGNYAVTIEKPRTVTDRQNSGIELEVDDFKGKFADVTNPNWTVTISDGDNQLEPFQLE